MSMWVFHLQIAMMVCLFVCLFVFRHLNSIIKSMVNNCVQNHRPHIWIWGSGKMWSDLNCNISKAYGVFRALSFFKYFWYSEIIPSETGRRLTTNHRLYGMQWSSGRVIPLFFPPTFSPLDKQSGSSEATICPGH